MAAGWLSSTKPMICCYWAATSLSQVLRQQFVHDEEFIRRFRREAQSAASLSHPNVVSIYDVGQEDEVHYIVMEYVEGHNLNEIIKERALLADLMRLCESLPRFVMRSDLCPPKSDYS